MRSRLQSTSSDALTDDSFSIPTEIPGDIPSESMLQVPQSGSLPMPSRPGVGGSTLWNLHDATEVREAQLVHPPRSHLAFSGASRGSVVNLPHRSEIRRRPPLFQQPLDFYGTRRPPFAVSPYPVGQPAALQGDGAYVPIDESCSPRSFSSSSSEPEEARPERLRVNSYAFSRIRPERQNFLPAHRAMRVNSHDRARSVPLAERDHRARVIYEVTPREVQSASGSSRPSAVSSGPETMEAHTLSERPLSHHLSAPELPSPWQVAEELGQNGGMAAPRYLLVRLGECIPAETGAAPVHRSRLDCGPQWKDFLNFAEYSNPEGVSLQEVLTCPCCLSIFRQPIGLPCGHSLCRGCYVRVFSQSALSRKCPLCRMDLPRFDLRVNVALAAVSDALRSFLAVQRPNPRVNLSEHH